MIKSFAIISLLTSAAFAQSASSSAASSTATANPLIPSGISETCKTFLTTLNSDNDLTACTQTLIDSTSAFGAGGNASSTPSKATVSSALTSLCSTDISDKCPDSLIRGKLANFYTACSSELSSNDDVIKIYDVLYAITPLKTAVCSKDDSGNWCVLDAEAPSSLSRRAESSAVTPNIEMYSQTNLPFLFLTASLSSDKLCVSCTRSVLVAYITFESQVPYAPGLSNSKLLNNQTPLYTGVVNTCGSTFLNSAGVAAAGGLKGGTLSSGAASLVSADFRELIALSMGMVTLAVSAF